MSAVPLNPGVGLVRLVPYPFIAFNTSGLAALSRFTSVLSIYPFTVVLTVDITHPAIVTWVDNSWLTLGKSIFINVFGAPFTKFLVVVWTTLLFSSNTSIFKVWFPYVKLVMSADPLNPGVGLVKLVPYPDIAFNTSDLPALFRVTSVLSTYPFTVLLVVDITHPAIVTWLDISWLTLGKSIFVNVLGGAFTKFLIVVWTTLLLVSSTSIFKVWFPYVRLVISTSLLKPGVGFVVESP